MRLYDVINLKLDEPCDRCGSYSYEIRHKKPHIGLYCKCCGTWVKWLSKKEQMAYGAFNLYKSQEENEVTRIDVKNVEYEFVDELPFD